MKHCHGCLENPHFPCESPGSQSDVPPVPTSLHTGPFLGFACQLTGLWSCEWSFSVFIAKPLAEMWVLSSVISLVMEWFAEHPEILVGGTVQKPQDGRQDPIPRPEHGSVQPRRPCLGFAAGLPSLRPLGSGPAVLLGVSSSSSAHPVGPAQPSVSPPQPAVVGIRTESSRLLPEPPSCMAPGFDPFFRLLSPLTLIHSFFSLLNMCLNFYDR